MATKTITQDQVQRLCEQVKPLLSGARYTPEPDPIRVCMLASLDFQMRGSMVFKAIDHFYHETAPALRISDLANLDTLLERTPSDEEAAVALWGARYWTRAALLRQLVAFFLQEQAARGGPEIEAMRAWAKAADFKLDFQGKIKGLGYNTFVRMVQQLGAPTAAPTGWSCHYVTEVLGETPSDQALVELLNAAADRLEYHRADLDWAIRWHQGHP